MSSEKRFAVEVEHESGDVTIATDYTLEDVAECCTEEEMAELSGLAAGETRALLDEGGGVSIWTRTT